MRLTKHQLESVNLFVGLPVETVSDCNSVNHMNTITDGLKPLKLLGVERIESPIFWRVVVLVEKEAAGKYEWSGYLAVTAIVQLYQSAKSNKKKSIDLPTWKGNLESALVILELGGTQEGCLCGDN